ncbi:MAG: DUF4442 domain-containing protein [Chlorobi bacterium]|nr:DUF4442 domain-containing protein [Chlorobiota bacterium]
MTDKQMKIILRRVSLYPPYLGAGIKLKSVNEDYTRFEVIMKLKWFNRNIYGTHFGGSLYAMTDPFFVFIIANYLGKNYVVWDKSAKINFKKPGKGRVRAIFEISKEKLAEIKSETDKTGKKTFFFNAEILNDDNEVIAEVEKEVYIRNKNFIPKNQ